MFSQQNTLVSPLQITWVGVSMSQKSLPKQLRHLVSLAGIWLLHLGVHKEVAYKILVHPKLEYAAPIWSPHMKLQINQIEKVQRTASCWTCRRWRNTSSVGEMLDELEWPSLEALRDQSSLLLFHKIHFGAVSIEKDKYMTPAHSLKSTRSSHSAQYRRHQTYSDALKNPFSPELFHIGIVCPFLWQIKRGSSVVRHLPLVLEVPGSIPARGEKNFGVRTRFL